VARWCRRAVLTRWAVRAALALAGPLVAAGPPAPLAVETLAGDPVALAPREGRALVVHFFATWCPSCGEEIPELARASAACVDSVEIALVDVDEEPEAVRRFLAAHGVALPALRDPGGRAWRASVGGRGLPANLIWTGDQRRSDVGPKPPGKWRELLAALGCEGRLPAP
jgi:thiol-disulfide isomerase/thioredoxin